MKLKQVRQQWLPNTVGGIIIAVFGYLVLLLGLVLVFTYFFGEIEGCVRNDKALRVAFILGTAQIALAIATLLLTRGLTKFTTLFYKIMAVIFLATILIVQLGMAMGYAFGVGTACS